MLNQKLLITLSELKDNESFLLYTRKRTSEKVKKKKCQSKESKRMLDCSSSG